MKSLLFVLLLLSLTTTPAFADFDFVDPEKDPEYYIDRYYNEPEYKSWFNRNYPEHTIEEAVGLDVKSNELKLQDSNNILPNAEAVLIPTNNQTKSNNSEVSQFILAVAGLALLFGATYGVKRKVDHNSRQIIINRDTLRKRIIIPIMGTNPRDVLKIRLAKGEITLHEYDVLKRKLEN